MQDSTSVARAIYEAYLRKDRAAIESLVGRFRNTEVLTLRGQKIIEAEVYFGWSIPHPAPVGGFTNA